VHQSRHLLEQPPHLPDASPRDRIDDAALRRQVFFFLGRDRGMVFFLAFLIFTTIFVPMVTLSLVGRLVLSLTFALTLIFGASATIQHRPVIYLVVALAVSTFVVDLFAELAPGHGVASVDTTLRLGCLSILVTMTLRRTLSPGPVTAYRVIGGIAGYLLIGLTWAFAYQLLLQQAPGAIHFEAGMADDTFSRQPNHLIYFSFITLTTVGYGDVHPVHPAVRSLAVAEALVGQLYLAILISSLAGMALQARSAKDGPPDPTQEIGR
jgi:hypothetical protein